MSEEERVINKLVADNKALRDLVDWQAAENKRLQSEHWLWVARCHSAIGLLPDEMVIGEIQKAAKEAEAKIERLREALADIANIINPYEDGDTMQEIARAALREGKE